MALLFLWTALACACAQAGKGPPAGGREPVVAAPSEPPSQAAPTGAAPASLASPGAPLPASSCGGSAPSLRWPAPGRVTSGFGTRKGRHAGIDIAGYHGQGVRAAAAGTVVFSESKGGYGRLVILEHGGGLETVYAHNQDLFVLEGERVEQGRVIADMGSTGRSSGPHLHFEVRVAGRPVDPLACLPPRPQL